MAGLGHKRPQPSVVPFADHSVRRLHSSTGRLERPAPQDTAQPTQAVHHGEGQQRGMERRVEADRRTQSTNNGQHKPNQCPTQGQSLCHDLFHLASDSSSQASRIRGLSRHFAAYSLSALRGVGLHSIHFISPGCCNRTEFEESPRHQPHSFKRRTVVPRGTKLFVPASIAGSNRSRSAW